MRAKLPYTVAETKFDILVLKYDIIFSVVINKHTATMQLVIKGVRARACARMQPCDDTCGTTILVSLVHCTLACIWPCTCRLRVRRGRVGGAETMRDA